MTPQFDHATIRLLQGIAMRLFDMDLSGVITFSEMEMLENTAITDTDHAARCVVTHRLRWLLRHSDAAEYTYDDLRSGDDACLWHATLDTVREHEHRYLDRSHV